MSAKEAYYKDLIDDNTSNFSTLWIVGELANLKKTKNTFPSEIVTDNDVIDQGCQTRGLLGATLHVGNCVEGRMQFSIYFYSIFLVRCSLRHILRRNL